MKKHDNNTMRPCVYVIIPNKNGIDHLSYSIPSLQMSTYPECSTIMVDDYSTDGSQEFVKSNYPWITIIKNNRNRGFAGAVNTGIKYSLDHGAEYIAIFNSDIKVLPNWIEPALQLFKEHNNVGLVGYTEILKEKQEIFNNTDYSKFEWKEVKRLPGCLFICPSSVFCNVGLLDEGYFMYGEDNDFFYRLIKARYTIIQTNIPVWHYGQGTSENQPFLAVWLAYRNALRFAIKNYSMTGVFCLLMSLLNQGCNMFLSERVGDANWKRMRRYNVFVNFLLIIGSLCWNLAHLIPILRLRYNSNKFSKKD